MKKQFIKTTEGATSYFSDEAMTVLHREDGPAVEHADGSKLWYINGEYHREDGPAGEFASGHKSWYINGKLHREDGPAVEYANGENSWHINGERHREDGPAVDYDGNKEWYLNDKHLTEEEFNTRMKKKAEYIKSMVTEVSIRSDIPNWNPIFNSIRVGPDDESGGSFLKITAEDERNDGACIRLDWNEWDSIVAVVAKYREDWDWEA